MQLLDERNCVIKTLEVIQHLHRLVLADPAITSVVSEVSPTRSSGARARCTSRRA